MIPASVRIVVAAALLPACSSNGGSGADAAALDAAIDGPRGNCDTGEIESQGDWTDWDSTDQMFRGIFGATLAEGDNSVQTAPNGRAVICLSVGADHTLTFSHADYLPMTAGIAASDLGHVYSVHGLTPARADELFAQELSLTLDVGAAQILVELPAGASASIDTAAAGEFSVPNAGYLFFANVEVGDGEASLAITPPSGQSCAAVDTLPLEAGVIAFASVACR